MRRLLRTVFVEVPSRFLAFADTGSAAARLLGVAVLVAVLGTGAALGAGAAALLGRDVGDGLAVGVVGAAVAVAAYGVLLLGLLLGTGLASRDQDRARGRAGRRSAARDAGTLPVALWAAAASFGVLGALVGVVTATLAVEELPYRGPRAEAEGTLTGWRDTAGGRVLVVAYAVDGARRTAEVAIEDAPGLDITSVVGDRAPLEYPLSAPARVRGAGEAAEMASTVAVSGWAALACLVTAAVCGVLARWRGRRARGA